MRPSALLATNYNYYIRVLHAHTAKIAVHLFSRGVEMLIFEDSFLKTVVVTERID